MHLAAQFVQQVDDGVVGIEVEQIVEFDGQTHHAADVEAVVAHARARCSAAPRRNCP